MTITTCTLLTPQMLALHGMPIVTTPWLLLLVGCPTAPRLEIIIEAALLLDDVE
jgi:hypothetical protein